jgi:hypothetical protein
MDYPSIASMDAESALEQPEPEADQLVANVSKSHVTTRS